VIEELTNGETVKHCGRLCLTASVTTWLSARTRQLMTSVLTLFAH